MVNRGASQGCITCRKRRVKCDETKPFCNECIRIGRPCAGYGKLPVRVRFKEVTPQSLSTLADHRKTAEHPDEEKQAMSRTKGHSCAQQPIYTSNILLAIPKSLQPEQLNIAVEFYLRYITEVGRNLQSTRGFLEFVRPVLSSESQGSALSTAVNAAAIKLWELLRPSDVAASRPIQLHQQALIKLQQEISSSEEKGKDALVLATLVLQHLDSLVTVFDSREVKIIHRKGALALLTQKGRNMRHLKYHSYLLGNLFHSKVSFCVRHKVALTETELKWLQTQVIPALPDNPSYQLDVIGLSVSRLQTTFNHLKSQGNNLMVTSKVLPAVIRNIDAQLRTWLDEVPDTWRPRAGESSIAPSVVTYNGSCDIYPSVQIANIWNTWRTYRLIVEFTKTAISHRQSAVYEEGGYAVFSDQLLHGHDEEIPEIESLVESVCRSIPFYLGNFSQPLRYSDIDILVFPSYHDLPPSDEAFVLYKQSNNYASKVDHHRHTALHGPLHALTILSSLMDLLSEQPHQAAAHGLPNRQKHFVEEQLHRCLRLTLLHSRTSVRSEESDYPSFTAHVSAPKDNTRAIRQALSTVTIL